MKTKKASEFLVRTGNIGEFEKKKCNKTLIKPTKSERRILCQN